MEMNRLMSFARALCVTALAAGAACTAPDARKAKADSAAVERKKDSAAAPSRTQTITGFKAPESVKYDSALDVFFVSSTNGDELAKDDNGFISRMRADGTIDSLLFIAGGRNGVTLHSPHGLAIIADTLWVADLDAVRGFNKNTGALVASVDLQKLGAVFLNDIAAAPDGSLYVTDTGPDGKSTKTKGNRIFRVGPDHQASVALHSDSLGSPNGITWDPHGKRFIIVQWGDSHILSWRPGDAVARTIGFGANQSDGVELLPDGRLVLTSWAEHALIIDHANQKMTVRGFSAPADFAVDTRRSRLAIPIMDQDRVEFYALPPLQP
jgi:sugar lactone lactonase YvrE